MLHFSADEFAQRRGKAEAELERRGLDGLLVFAPESQYWLTGYDTFGYCFFQSLILGAEEPVLLTRSADLRQAELTSNIKDIRVWTDGEGVNPTLQLRDLLQELGLSGKRLGIETDTHGLTGFNGRRVEEALNGIVKLEEASDLISNIRLIKSPAEIAYTRRAGQLADAALDAAVPLVKPGAHEGDILAAMQGAVFAGGGDYPGNEFIIGSDNHALLCRYTSGRRKLADNDQLTLEWAGVYRHYHAAMMRTLVIGEPRDKHYELHAVAQQALMQCEAALRPGVAMAEVYTAHANVMDDAGLSSARLNACGYALGARFSPSWMEKQMFFQGAATIMQPGMVFFLHMIIMDSNTQTAMCLGRSSLVSANGSEPLSNHPIDMMAL